MDACNFEDGNPVPQHALRRRHSSLPCPFVSGSRRRLHRHHSSISNGYTSSPPVPSDVLFASRGHQLIPGISSLRYCVLSITAPWPAAAVTVCSLRRRLARYCFSSSRHSSSASTDGTSAYSLVVALLLSSWVVHHFSHRKEFRRKKPPLSATATCWPRCRNLS